MKIIKIIKNQRKGMNDEDIKKFIYKNLPKEMISGLEYDDPKTIERVLKLLGMEYKKIKIEDNFYPDDKTLDDKAEAS